VRPGALWLFYRARLRARPVHELFALLGIATGVALVFAVIVANASIAGSVDKLVHAVQGRATLEVAARSERGFGPQELSRIAATPGVVIAAPLLESRATIRGRDGTSTVTLVGVTSKAVALGGITSPRFRQFGRFFDEVRALVVPKPLADDVGADLQHRATIDVNGAARRVFVLPMPEAAIGALVQSPVAITSLAYAQALAGRPGRISRALIVTRPGADASVRASLRRTFGDRLDVRASDTEAKLVRQAAAPNDQSTSLFATICAIVGFLFAFNAMLLTVPERRALVVQMQWQGFSARQILSMLAFEAIILGLVGSAFGLFLGDLLSRYVFEASPGYLSFAFPVGGQRVVSASAIAIAVGTGLVGSLVASAQLFADVYRRVDDEPGSPEAQARQRRTAGLVPWLGGLLLLVTVFVVLVLPSATIVGIGALVIAMLLLLPAALRWLVRAAATVAPRLPWGWLLIAVGELRASNVRSTVLAATAALAVFGVTAIEGAHQDLLDGLDHASYGLTHSSDVWVSPAGRQNTLTTVPFRVAPAELDALARAPEIAAVRTYQGGFFDYGSRRVWVIGRPPGDHITIPEGQVLSGHPGRAARRVRAGGWAAVSDAIVREHDMRVGDAFVMPGPRGPVRLRLAARLSNVGWPPGTIIMSQPDYARAWGVTDPSALEIDLAPGVGPAQGTAAVHAVLGPDGRGLSVQTADQRWEALRTNARQGLDRLTQISTLLTIAAVLATAAAVSAGVWQRRRQLATMRTQGFGLWQLWASVLGETGLLLVFGGMTGALFGLAGQFLLSRWLVLTTGFPALYTPAIPLAVAAFAVVAAVTLAVVALPGYLAARAPLALSFGEE